MSTRSAATSALSVSRPSDGGESMMMKSNSIAQRIEQSLQAAFAIGERDQFDLGAGEFAIGGDQREPFDARWQDETVGA